MSQTFISPSYRLEIPSDLSLSLPLMSYRRDTLKSPQHLIQLLHATQAHVSRTANTWEPSLPPCKTLYSVSSSPLVSRSLSLPYMATSRLKCADLSTSTKATFALQSFVLIAFVHSLVWPSTTKGKSWWPILDGCITSGDHLFSCRRAAIQPRQICIAAKPCKQGIASSRSSCATRSSINQGSSIYLSPDPSQHVMNKKVEHHSLLRSIFLLS